MKRPTPGEVVEIVAELGATGETVSVPTVVAAIRRRTACSRATAYRGVADAMAGGFIKRNAGARAETSCVLSQRFADWTSECTCSIRPRFPLCRRFLVVVGGPERLPVGTHAGARIVGRYPEVGAVGA
jgi:hypothetical protein